MFAWDLAWSLAIFRRGRILKMVKVVSTNKFGNLLPLFASIVDCDSVNWN